MRLLTHVKMDSLHSVVRQPLTALLVLALALRCAWWFAYVHVLENEGVVFARLAQSLIAGEGMIGIFGGRDILDAPLFPLLIGLLGLLMGSEEIAGRVLGILCGTALVAVLYALGKQLFNARVALYAGLLAAVHPLTIGLSVSMYAEGVWILLVVFGLYAAIRALPDGSAAWLAGAGLSIGAAYLVRQEALAFAAYLAVALFIIGLMRRSGVLHAARATAIFVIACGVLALPYIGYLSNLADGFRWEGKSAYNNVQNQRIRSGMTVPQAARGLDEDGSAGGVFLHMHKDQAELLRQPKATGHGLLHTLFDSFIERVLRIVRRVLTAQFISAPWILLPAAVGVLLSAWWRTQLWQGWLLLGVSAIQLAFLLSVDQLWARYFFAFIPLLILWASVGIDMLAGQVNLLLRDRRRWRLLEPAAAVLGVTALAGSAYASVREVGELRQADETAPRAMGAWMAQDARARGINGRPLVMGVSLASVYYAGGTMRYLPHADAAAALAYVHSMQPHYLVLRRSELRQAPYVETWLTQGIPDACAVRVSGGWEQAEDASRVWRWQCAAPAP